MKKLLSTSLILAAALGMAACEKKSVDKAQDAQAHNEQAQEKIDSAKADLASAMKERDKAAKDNEAAKKAAADEAKQFVPTNPQPEGGKPEAPRN